MSVWTGMQISDFAIDVAGGLTWARLAVSGELDLATSDRLWAAIEREMLATRSVVLDLSGVSFMDVTGLGVVLRAMRGAQASAWNFGVAAALPPAVMIVARTTEVLAMLPLVEDQ